MTGFLAKMRRHEPLRLILWPIVASVIGALLAKGAIAASDADLIMALVVLVLGGGGVEAARARVTPGAHVTDAVTGVVEQVRARVPDALGQPGIDALAHLEQMLTAAAEGRGLHEKE